MTASHTSTDLPQAIASLAAQRIQANELELPVLSSSIQDILASQNPDTDLAMLAEVISGDQSIAAHVMRIANTATYAPTEPIVSLAQALSRLGLQN